MLLMNVERDTDSRPDVTATAPPLAARLAVNVQLSMYTLEKAALIAPPKPPMLPQLRMTRLEKWAFE
jgi:hypothetical protein